MQKGAVLNTLLNVREDTMNPMSHGEVRQILINVNRADGIYYQFARGIGIKENTLALFYALSDDKPHSQKEICDEWLIPRSTINTIVREYAEGGYIRLEKSTRAKEKELLLTEKGKKYANELMNRLFSAEQEAFAKTAGRYGEEFVPAFAFFVDELRERLLHDEP